MSPVKWLKGIRPALAVAVSTASSAATLPVTIEACEENLDIPPPVASFVLPLGATMNMDGTALYEAIAALFVAQAYGIELGIGQQIIVFLTAAAASVGAAGIPSAGLVTMAMVFTAVGLPLEGIGLILAVESGQGGGVAGHFSFRQIVERDLQFVQGGQGASEDRRFSRAR